MTTFDLLLYLADYIDESRTFDDCVRLREHFWNAAPDTMDHRSRMLHLYETVILSCDYTVASLIKEGAPISPDTIHMRNDLIARLQTL